MPTSEEGATSLLHDLPVGSSREHEIEKECAKLGATWLSTTLLSQYDESMLNLKAIFPDVPLVTMAQDTGMVDVNLSLGLQLQSIPAKPTITSPPSEHEPMAIEDWDLHLVRAVRKAKEAYKLSTTKYKEMQGVNQGLVDEVQNLKAT